MFALNQRDIIEALDANKPIRVYTICHDVSFDLNDFERERLSNAARTAV
jgi:hypothetical protein